MLNNFLTQVPFNFTCHVLYMEYMNTKSVSEIITLSSDVIHNVLVETCSIIWKFILM